MYNKNNGYKIAIRILNDTKKSEKTITVITPTDVTPNWVHAEALSLRLNFSWTKAAIDFIKNSSHF